MSRSVPKPDPLRRPAIAFGCLIAITIAFAAFGPKVQLPPPEDRAPVAERRAVNFIDEPNGGVIVIDGETGERITRLGVGEGGFVRSMMRGLARERTLNGIPREPPFILHSLTDGTLLIADPEMGKTIRLGAFGQANAAAFAAFLDHGREPQ